jgi:hypothetical protein
MKNPTVGTKFVFSQEADSCSIDAQELTVEICDGGAGKYVRISTEAWAMDLEDYRGFLARIKWCLKVCEEKE